MCRHRLHREVWYSGILGAVLLCATQSANAHAKLELSAPADKSTVSAIRVISLRFSEAIEPSLSSVRLVGANGIAIPIQVVAEGSDKTSLMVKLGGALEPGAYSVIWSVVSDDGHKTKGTVHFSVQ
jgi:methionine-rich copper-binding protein CopC